MEFVFRTQKIAEAPQRWAEQYKDWRSADKTAITAKLLSLPIGFTAKDVNDIIGNTSWTALRCDECGTDSEVLVGLGRDNEHNCASAYVCRRCITGSCAALGAAINTLPK
jgi:hypothetical protein